MSNTTTSTYSKWLLPLLLIVSFFVLWQVAATQGWINRSLMSSPSEIASQLTRMHQRELPERSILLTHIGYTLQRLLLATIIGTLAGGAIGAAMGLNRHIYRFLDPLITVIMPIPGIALAPLFIIWLGFGDITVIAVGAIATFFPVVYNTAAGVRTVDNQLVRAAQMMGANRITTLLNVHLPWALAYMLLGIKLGLARGWRTVVAVELIAATNWGLGYMIWDAAEYLRAGLVYGGIIIMIVVFFIIERGLLDAVERNTLVKWGMLSD
ncbi:MAG: ABC transporter permease [Chloroflexota bacterium]